MKALSGTGENLRHYQMQSVLGALLRVSLLSIPFEEQLDLILNEIVSIPWLALQSKGAIFLIDEDSEELVMKSQREMGREQVAICARVPMGRCLCGRAALQREVVFAQGVDERHDYQYDGMPSHGHYCVPLLSNGKVSGVINLYVRGGHVRDDAEEKFLRAAADVLASILERRRVMEDLRKARDELENRVLERTAELAKANADLQMEVAERKRAEDELQRSYEKLHRALEGTIQAMALAVEMRDPYTAGHQKHVAHLACAIAKGMGLPEDRVRVIRLAALVHDVGKISIPAEILSKPGRLSGVEFALIKAHPDIAYDILKTVEFPWSIAEIVRQHHEKMNGSGYPLGLKGDEILLEARILGVADAVEAMASHRPYRPALGINAAIEEISINRGVLYDADVVDACLRIFAEKVFDFTTAWVPGIPRTLVPGLPSGWS